MEKNMTVLRTKAMLNFALSLIPKGGKKCTFYLSLKAPILIRNDRLTSEESKSKAKNCL